MIRTRVLMIVAITFWGWSFVATKVALGWLTPVEVIGLRMVVAVPFLLIVLRARGIRFGFRGREHLILATAALTFLVHLLIQIQGLTTTTAVNTGWIIAVTPATLAALSFIFLRERLSPIQIAGIVVATVGIVLLVSRGELATIAWLRSYGDWLIVASTITWPIFTILTRDLSRAHSPLAVTCAVLIPAGVAALIAMALMSDWSALVRLPLKPILAVLFLGLCSQSIAFWIWQESIARIGAAKAGFFLYLEPLATTALAVPYLGESLVLAQAAGGVLILAGVYLTERRS